mmetsp:Transcript_36429/g.96897  ORF Transcript_36429/g.96897 Transcript_36429/m.96897 type:complete len:201 (+) Transcript_36429:370-972(+)
MPLIDIGIGWLVNPWQFQGWANESEQLRRRSGQHGQPPHAHGHHSWDSKIVQPESKIPKTVEDTVRFTLSKTEHGMQLVSILEAILHEALAILQNHAINSAFKACSFLESTRNHADRFSFTHQREHSFFAAVAETTMRTLECVKKDPCQQTFVPQSTINDVVTLSNGLMELRLEHDIRHPTDGKNPVWMASKEAPRSDAV